MRKHVALVSALFLLGVARPSFADDKSDAQALLQQGNQLVGDGEYLAALEKFKAAHARFASAKIFLNIGTTLRLLGRNVEAAEYYERYLADTGAEPGKAAEAKRALEEIDAVVARLEISVGDRAATVRLDGVKLDPVPPSIRVPAGEHTVVAELTGFQTAVQTFTVVPREKRVVTLRLLPPETKDRVVVVAHEAPPKTTQRNLGLVLGGVGGAAVIAGAVLGVMAKSKNDVASAHCFQGTACDADGVSTGQTAKSFAGVSTVLFIAGGAVLATGAVLLFTAPSRKPARPAAPRVGLVALPEGAFASVSSSW